MVDGAGDTVLGPDGNPLDDVEEVHEGPSGGDEEPDLVPSGGNGFHPTNPGSQGGGSEEVDLEEGDPFFGQAIVEAAEEEDD